MPRRPLASFLIPSALVGLGALGASAYAPVAEANQPIPASQAVEELDHSIEVELSREGATLRVTRSFVNGKALPAIVELPLPLPCDATLDGVGLREQASWRRAELLPAQEASQRWGAWLDDPRAFLADPAAPIRLDGDTALHVSRDDYGCEVQLSLYPVPPLRERSVGYSVFIPSRYDEGRYTIELPAFASYGSTASIELLDPQDPALALTVDARPASGASLLLDGARTHLIELTPHDRGRGQVRLAALDLDALAGPADPADPGEAAASEQLLRARFEIPSELASLPPVRRVVVLIDASHSVDVDERAALSELAASYLSLLGDDPEQPTRAEIVLFDRAVHRVYQDFVPASWAGEDLAKLEIEGRNGSEVGDAMDYARELLAAQREGDGPTQAQGADWILVMSDLYLRQDFDAVAARERASVTPERVHLVRLDASRDEFGPGPADDPWTAVARAAGGMLWELDTSGDTLMASAGAELIAPRRLWSPTLALDFGGAPVEQALGPWLDAGASEVVTQLQASDAPLSRAVFSGQVWGQARAWTGAPSSSEGLRLAGAFATHDEDDLLTSAQRSALAVHAQVVSPFTSAWVTASFEGPPPPAVGGIGTLGLSGYGSSSHCGGCSWGHSCAAGVHAASFEELTQPILDRCQARAGAFEFETTDLEIVAVTAVDSCVRDGLWSLDIHATRSHGRHQIRASYVTGKLTELRDDAPR